MGWRAHVREKLCGVRIGSFGIGLLRSVRTLRGWIVLTSQTRGRGCGINTPILVKT